jgi:hypothetical protein
MEWYVVLQEDIDVIADYFISRGTSELETGQLVQVYGEQQQQHKKVYAFFSQCFALHKNLC